MNHNLLHFVFVSTLRALVSGGSTGVAVGESCTTASACTAPGDVCQNGVCKIGVAGDCSLHNSSCIENAECVSNICECNPHFIMSDGACVDPGPDFRLHQINGVETDNILEVYLNGIWRAVGVNGYQFPEATAQVVCNHFGYGYIGYSSTLTSTEYNYTAGLWSMDLLNCGENATELRDCVNPAYVNITTPLMGLPIRRIKCSGLNVSKIRLTGGEVPSEGRLEVLVGAQWGTVCTFVVEPYAGYPLSSDNKDRICQMLGYFQRSSDFYKSQLTNEAFNPILLTLEGCSDLTSLVFEKHCNVIKGEFQYCGFHSHDVLLKCEAIRLVDGPNTYSGRIEASINGSLVTLCDYRFDIQTANVACNTFGYTGARQVISSTPYGSGELPLYTGRISCNGDEKSLDQCHHETIEDSPCNNQRVVGVVCQGGPMKLEPFAHTAYEGIFTTSHADKWYHFTGNITDLTAKTLCNMTGFGFKGYGISLPQSSSNIQRQSLQCFGGETNVLECTSETVQCLRVGWRGVCESWPQSVLGLYCNDYNIENVLLISLFPYGGAFEVLVDSEWGSPSAELGLIEAQIICKHFGFVNAQNTIKLSEPYQHFKTKLNGVLRCKGNESSPFECAFKHQGYLGVTDVGFTLVNCSRECRQGRYGFGRCDKDCLCISANTIICDHVSGECTCTSGWAGSYCETDINECLTQNICPDGMDCVNQNGSYECTCRPGTMVSDDLSRCIDCPRQSFGWNCVSSCQCSLQNILTNGRDCDSVTGECQCSHGWAGTLCDSDIDECLNRSVCSEVKTECRNEEGGFRCDCVEGYARNNNHTCFAIKVEEKGSSNTLLIVIICGCCRIGVRVSWSLLLCKQKATERQAKNVGF
ncbi:scavenger receptor cysteine-rich type 1 protein M130-like [Mya arenaria]|uniref:scavenger receptor cysteine-rich type 1 protein M130-like n=1 Tax=Mya arenaria TaxID=6604 RepID=UPI0022E8E6EF|nr:scavenger receptor cysteine-rich type 1 protein M130-like [Mya arenaria]